eukprot:jgi/Hompol1/2341/HPOL_005951-RA
MDGDCSGGPSALARLATHSSAGSSAPAMGAAAVRTRGGRPDTFSLLAAAQHRPELDSLEHPSADDAAAFGFASMAGELNRIHHGIGFDDAALHAAWDRHEVADRNTPEWSSEFAGLRHRHSDNMHFGGDRWASEFAHHPDPLTLHEHDPAMFNPKMTDAERAAFEEEWSKQFSAVRAAAINSSTLSHPDLDDELLSKAFEAAAATNADQSKADWETEFKRHAEMLTSSELEHTDITQDKEWLKLFDNAWKSIAKHDPSAVTEDDFESAFLAAAAKSTSESPFSFEEQFRHLLAKDAARASDSSPDLGLLSEMVDPDPITAPLMPYTFEPSNRFLEHSDPLQEGLRIVESHGSLSEAALAFEAAVQRDPHNSEAWKLLGEVQAENEKETPAIAALQRSVQEAPDNGPALMSLAVSYINELQELKAYATLNRWLAARYPTVASVTEQRERFSYSYPAKDLHATLTSQFLAIASDPTLSGNQAGHIDPDVQIGLGLLYYTVEQYDKTIDCFTSALSARPKDYHLWNKLGATLANSGRTEEAIDAYHHALELKPSFVRGRYNLGVACINIGCHKEAAEHILSALSMHGSDHQNQANISLNLWETLRRALTLMDRHDLAVKIDQSADVSQFRGEFDF